MEAGGKEDETYQLTQSEHFNKKIYIQNTPYQLIQLNRELKDYLNSLRTILICCLTKS